MTVSTAPSSVTIVGGQWGDEGKGKVVDLLSGAFPVVARYNGGHNAGHTVRFADRHFALHLVPSGIIHEGVMCYLGAGMVVEPGALLAEIDRLADEGVDSAGRILLSERATLILPTHQALDAAREGARGSGRIGTTGRGIGPAYQDASGRRALRAHLLRTPDRLVAEARTLMLDHNRELQLLHNTPAVDVEAHLEALVGHAERLGPMVREIGPELHRHLRLAQPILFEGAQGVLLDILHGTYPYVTSSSCLPAFAAVSCGLSPRLLGPVIGVMKAYVTRVGGGPFPTELGDEAGDALRDRGNEFGTTTGRPRRCGWFDAVAARYAVRVAGIDAVALMKLDVLDDMEEIRVAVAYELPDGSLVDSVPPDLVELAGVVPRYEALQGWRTATRAVTRAADLPTRAEAYLRFIEREIGVPIVLVSTGPRREETLLRGSGPYTKVLESLSLGVPVP